MESGETVSILWFKRDLRLSDHRPLHEACKLGQKMLPVYFREPNIRKLSDFGWRHDDFIESSLYELQSDLREKGSDLLVLDMDAVPGLQWLLEQLAVTHLYAHEETGNWATFQRDIEVAKLCKAKRIVFREHCQNGVARGLRDRDGWARIWHQRMYSRIEEEPKHLPLFPKAMRKYVIPLKARNTKPHHQSGGRAEAINTLESFLLERGRAYHREMSSPLSAETACSRLSSFLSYGCISMREIVQFAEGRKMALKEAGDKGFPIRAINSFLSRCHWHCHFMQKLEREPQIEFHCFNRTCDELRGRPANAEALQRWQAGNTGYPFLDACMRYLDANGWINFRMRAMITSFAAYNLWIDWRDFKDWLACQFQDYEPGIHISQVQMQSGVTGINTLRIYNVVKQGHDQDAQGVFIRRWVPELAGYPDSHIHEPWKVSVADQSKFGCILDKQYPLPIIDLATSVKHARAQFAELRRNSKFWDESERVREVHGSRKSQEVRPKRPRVKKDNDQLELSL